MLKMIGRYVVHGAVSRELSKSKHPAAKPVRNTARAVWKLQTLMRILT